jgi:transposase-like protein
MLVQFECPSCGEFNEACLCGRFEIKDFKCHGCGTNLDVYITSNKEVPEVYESQNQTSQQEEQQKEVNHITSASM